MPSREVYGEILKLKLGEWNERIDMLQLLMKLAKQEVRDEVSERMERLRSKRDEFQSKVEDFQSADEEPGAAVRQSIESVHADLRETFNEVKSSLTR